MKENLSTVNINKIKVHYFFSEEMDISKFLTETEIKVNNNIINYINLYTVI